MGPWVTRRLGARLALAIALVVSGVAGPGSSPAAADDPKGRLRARAAELRRNLEEIDGELRKAVTAYSAAADAETRAVNEGFELAAQADAATEEYDKAARLAADRIRALYMGGGQLVIVATVMDAPDLHDAIARYHYASAVVGADHEQIERLTEISRAAEEARVKQRDATRRSIQLAAKARKAASRVEQLLARQRRLLADTDSQLRALIEAEARRARELAAMAAQAAAATPGGGPVYSWPSGRYACPVGAVHSFVDTWGAPRSGGRRHQGTDVFAPYGSPAYAVTDGVVDKWGNGGLGGITLWIKSDTGDRYYYAHNSVNLVPVGTRVRAGDIVARVGNTGNALTTPPHIHFEAHPGGGAAQNPYPFLKALCG